MENTQDLQFGKMSPEHFHQTKDKTLKPSLTPSVKSKTQVIMSLNLQPQNKGEDGNQQEVSWEMDSLLHGESLMLNIGAFPKEENESSLSQILQINVPPKYYLSQKACLGILRRASARGKELPPMLRAALEQQVAVDLTDTTDA